MHVAFSRAGGYEGGKKLLNQATRPTAIFASSDMQAIGVLRALHEAGLQVPGDVAIVTFDGSIESEFSWPPLTAVRQPTRLMAEAAVEALIGDSRTQSARYLSFPTELVVRISCGCGVLG